MSDVAVCHNFKFKTGNPLKLTMFILPEANTAFCLANSLWMVHCWLMFELRLVVLLGSAVSCHVFCPFFPCPLLSVEEHPVEPVYKMKEVDTNGR